MGKGIPNFLIFALSLVGTYYVMGLCCSKLAKPYIKQILPHKNLDSLDEQLNIFIIIMYFCGTLLFTLTVSTMLLKVLRGFIQSGFSDQNTGTIGVLNHITHNSIEQMIIFIPIYFYVLHNRGFGFKDEDLIVIAVWFVIGRLLYALGQLLGNMTGYEAFKTAGFMINLLSNLVLIAEIAGLPQIIHHFRA